MVRITLEDWEDWRAYFTINGKRCSGRAAKLGDFNSRCDWWSVWDFRHALLEAAEQAGTAGFDASKVAAYLREHGIGSTWSDGAIVV